MSLLQIELDAESMQLIQEEAKSSGVSPEQFVSSLVLGHLQNRSASKSTIPQEVFASALARTMREKGEAYRRLGQ
jgi:hypothetical protein